MTDTLSTTGRHDVTTRDGDGLRRSVRRAWGDVRLRQPRRSVVTLAADPTGVEGEGH